MPEGYSVRPATRDDLAVIAALIEASDTHDYGRVTFTKDDIDETWALPRFSPEGNTWLVTAGAGEVVGYGWMWLRHDPSDITAFALVHPDHRGLGIGAMVASLMEERARAIASQAPPDATVLFRQAIPGKDDRARELFERRGYAVIRHFIRMEIDVDASVSAPKVPEGIEIRSLASMEETHVVYDVLQDAMRDHWNFAPWTYDEFAKLQLRDPDLSRWFLAFEGGEAGGALIGAVENGVGWVKELGVRRAFRRRGIGDALLGHAFAAFAERGLKRIELQVDADSATGATMLYEKAGMRRSFFWTFMEKRLR